MNSWTNFIQDFKTYLKVERGLSDNTLTNYHYDLKRLVSFINEHNIKDCTPINIKKETTQQFIYQISKNFNLKYFSKI